MAIKLNTVNPAQALLEHQETSLRPKPLRSYWESMTKRGNKLITSLLERFSLDCRKTKTKVNPLANRRT